MKKIKYKSAAHKRAALEAEQYQKQMYAKWGITDAKKNIQKNFTVNYSHRSSDTIISRVDNSSGVCARKDSPRYTGDLITGIAVMHKSCLQPVINQEQAIESARMRR